MTERSVAGHLLVMTKKYQELSYEMGQLLGEYPIETDTIVAIDHEVLDAVLALGKLADIFLESEDGDSDQVSFHLRTVHGLTDNCDLILTGCELLSLCLDGEVQRLHSGSINTQSAERTWRDRFIRNGEWKDELMKDLLRQLRAQVQALSLLLQCFQAESANKSRQLLRRQEDTIYQITRGVIRLRSAFPNLRLLWSVLGKPFLRSDVTGVLSCFCGETQQRRAQPTDSSHQAINASSGSQDNHQYSRQAEQMSEKITPTYLCINCGESGHLTLFCKDRAAQPPAEKVVMRGDPGLCERCHYLDLPGLLKDPGEKRDGDFHGVRLSSSANADITGLIRHIQISHDHPLILQCPSCRVLFACADGRILMHDPQWRRGNDPPWMHFGLFRSYWRDYSLGGFARPVYEEDMNAFATYIQGLNHGGTVEGGDEVFALEAAAFADRPDPPALCARAVRSGEVDYSSIRDWLGICATKHGDSCSMPTSPLLRKIKLIDVKARRIVRHPRGNIQYLALSYVWGGVTLPPVGIGALPVALPATINDAITVTRDLGFQYLWVDMVCIDQRDSAKKAEQINLMALIYSCSYATIINLDGTSADAGLPLLTGPTRSPRQRVEDIRGMRVVSMLPTLDDLFMKSRWNTRAWTFQEGVLSTRRIIFTPYQIYFVCNRMSCRESMDWRSAAPRLLELVPVGSRSASLLRLGISVVSANQEADGFCQVYNQLINHYSQREMSFESDAVNAVGGILTKLQDSYFHGGFHYGLPVQFLRSALCWRTIKRELIRRRTMPSWSWAGWSSEGKIDLKESYDYPQPTLNIWRYNDRGGQLELLSADEVIHHRDIFLYRYPRLAALLSPPTSFVRSPPTPLTTLPDRKCLLVNGLLITLQIDIKQGPWRDGGGLNALRLRAGDHLVDGMFNRGWGPDDVAQVLLERSHSYDVLLVAIPYGMCFEGLILRWEESVAYRLGHLSFGATLDDDELWQQWMLAARLRMKKFWLG